MAADYRFLLNQGQLLSILFPISVNKNTCDGCRSSSNQRRIGSGRILRHDSQDDDRGFRREIPQLSELRKEARERRTGNGFHNDRGNGYGNRRHHDFDDERDYSDRRRGYRDYNRDGLRRHPSNEEPEWFSAGPTSQTDTIELRGFEEPPSRESSSAEREHRARDDDRGQLHDRFRDDGDAEAAAAESQGLQIAMFSLGAGGSREGVIRLWPSS